MKLLFFVFWLLYVCITGEILKSIATSACLIVLTMIIIIIKHMVFNFKTGNRKEILNNLLDFNISFLITFLGAIFAIVALHTRIELNVEMLLFFGASSLIQGLKKVNGHSTTIQWLENSNGLDYGTAMADSFFHGYLNLTLPNRGDCNMGLKETMDLYESQQGIEFNVQKLFILVPTSLYCPPNLADCTTNGDVYLEGCKSLESVYKNVAGASNRKYTHSVYKIQSRNGKLKQPIYVAAEGATPLHTFKTVLEIPLPDIDILQKHKCAIMHNFYRSLKRIIENDPECKNLCEVVYFNNADPKTDVAKVLLEIVNNVQKKISNY